MDAKNEKPSQLGAAHCSKAPRGGVCENGCPSSPGLPRDRKQREGSQASIKQSWLCWIKFMPGNKQDKIAWFKDAYAAERALKNRAASSRVLPSHPLCVAVSPVMPSRGYPWWWIGFCSITWIWPEDAEAHIYHVASPKSVRRRLTQDAVKPANHLGQQDGASSDLFFSSKMSDDDQHTKDSPGSGNTGQLYCVALGFKGMKLIHCSSKKSGPLSASR